MVDDFLVSCKDVDDIYRALISSVFDTPQVISFQCVIASHLS